MKLKQVIVMLVAAGAALLGAVTVSNAGWKVESDVVVTASNRTASGSMGTARNSADTVQYVSCGMDYDSIVCSAKNAAGTSASCSADAADTNYAALRQVVGSAGTDSFVSFQYNSSGVCTNIGVYHSSRYAPKVL